MDNKIIDGKQLSLELLSNLKSKIEKCCLQRPPVLVIVQVGNNLASNKYIKNKLKACETVGIIGRHLRLEENINQEDLSKKISNLNDDDEVDGIIVQLPLPNHIDGSKINNLISPTKDADGFTPNSMGSLILNNTNIFPATPSGILKLLKWKKVNLVGSNVVIIGRSNIVGKPLANILINESATVTICNTKTKNLSEICSKADILVSAAGSPGLVTKDFVKKDSIVIDVGANFVQGKYCGDVNFDDVISKVSLITPVPGGVGPMTIVCLLENVVNLYLNKLK